MRIVSLLPSATEIAFDLGLGDDVVGVTHECDFPAAAATKAVVSHSTLDHDGLTPAQIDAAVAGSIGAGEAIYRLDTDRFAALQPDLILAQDLCRVCAVPTGQVEEALETLGCTAEVISLDPARLDDVIECTVTVGLATGTEARAERRAAELRERVASVRAATRDLPWPRALALEWSDPPFTGGHWVPEMIEAAGATCLLGESGLPSRRASWEEIESADPGVVVFMPCGYGLDEAVAQGRELLERPEVEAASLLAVDASAYFSRPGPRLVDGVEALAWVLHPGAVAEPPPGRFVRLR
ncbi:MAG: cobalamin-binding protein [Acidimicrobiia bacterium]